MRLSALSCPIYRAARFVYYPYHEYSARTIGRIAYALRRRFAFAAIEADESKVSPIASKLFNDLKAAVEKILPRSLNLTILW